MLPRERHNHDPVELHLNSTALEQKKAPFLVRSVRGLKVRQKLRLCGLLSIGAGIVPTLFLLWRLDPSAPTTLEKSLLTSLVCSTAVVQGLGLLAAAFVARQILRDVGGTLHRLGDLVHAITAGDTGARIELDGRNDEVGALADALQKMIEAGRADRQTLLNGNVALILANERMAEANMELEAAHKRVSQLAEQAGTANIAKRTFLAVMSHEIRTPVNGIIGMTELAMKTPLNPAQRDYLETINNTAQGLLELLNEVLDFSKIEAGKLELEVVDFNLRIVVEDAIATFAARHHAKGLDLILDIHPDVPDALIGDPLRLRQVLMNLISNANRFTKEGEVVVAVDVEQPGEVETKLRFSVTDTGCGIPREKQRSIFEAFTQGDNSTTRRFGGSGLGLAISSQLVQMMGGAIRVISDVGSGSRFDFTANFGVGAESSGRVSHALAACRALVVESHPRSAELLGAMLEAWKLEVITVRNAVAALQVMERFEKEGRPFDFVIADTFRPAAGGLAIAQRIAGVATGRTRIILLAAAGRTDDPLLQLPSVAAVLSKPVRQSKLRETLEAALRPGDPGLPASSFTMTGSSPHGRRLRVLIAEDNATNRRIIRTHLEDWGHTVVAASDGAEAVAVFDSDAFDLVLMDLQMPEMDGIAATASIRQKEKPGTRVPIVALTANVLKGAREECHAAGMDGYLGKPVREHELLAGIESVIPGLRAASKIAAAHAIAPVSVSLSVIGMPFEADALLASVNGSRETLTGLLHDCRDDDVPVLFEQISSAIENGDTRKLQRAAHALKGVLGVFHAPAAYAAARQLEESARLGRIELLHQQTQALRLAVSDLLSSLECFVGQSAPASMAA